MRNWINALGVVSACMMVQAAEKPKIMDDGINMNTNLVYNMAYLDMAASSNDFRDAEVAHNAISVGQLVGINPQNGQMLTNAVNLLPIMVRSAYVAGTVDAGGFIGDGSGLANLNAGAVFGYLPIASMPTSGVWDVSGLTLKNANFEGSLSVGGQALDIESDLNVQGKLSGDASGLSNMPAGGTDGGLLDTDFDGLRDSEELAMGCDPLNPDSDLDGLLDGEEVAITLTDPLGTNSASDAQLVLSLPGRAAFNRERLQISTEYIEEEDDLIITSLIYDPSCTWSITNNTAGMYRLALQIEPNKNNLYEHYRIPIEISINGHVIGETLAVTDRGELAEGFVYTPWLDVGVYEVKCKFVRMFPHGFSVRIHRLELYAINGADSNGNGLDDWVEARFDTGLDSDRDGFTDRDELFVRGTDPLKADSDGDGLTDYEELQLGTDPTNADSDNDGVDDGTEVRQSLTDPLVAGFGTRTDVLTPNGSQAVVKSGDWMREEASIYSVDVPSSASDAVASENAAPIANNDNVSARKNTSVEVGYVLNNDTDGDSDLLRILSLTNPAHGTVVQNDDATFTYTPSNGYLGSDTFSYTVSDGIANDTATVNVTVGEFSHPGLLNSNAKWQALREQIENGTNPRAQGGLDSIKATPESSVNYTATPYALVEGSKSVSGIAFRKDGQAALYNAMLWIVTGDQAHAETAKQIIKDWSNTFVNFKNVDGGLWGSNLMAHWIFAAEILKHYNGGVAGWNAADQAQFESAMITEFTQKALVWDGSGGGNPVSGQNQNQAVRKTRLMLGIYSDDLTLFNNAYDDMFVNTVDSSAIIPHWNRAVTILERSVGYGGEIMELNREANGDIGHAGMTMKEISHIADIAYQQGRDVFQTKFYGNETDPAKKDTIPTVLAMSEYWAGAFFANPYEFETSYSGDLSSGWFGRSDMHTFNILYNEYNGRLKGSFAMPNTQKIIDLGIEETAHWTSLAHSDSFDNTSPKVSRLTVNNVPSTSWKTVTLPHKYTSAVIVATPIYPNSSVAPVVTRIRNVSGNTFQIRLNRADGNTGAMSLDVSVIAVEEGAYTVAEHGVKMEAVKYTSGKTATKGSWGTADLDSRSYQNSYSSPVVLGQVMSYNDSDWSTFVSTGSSRSSAPTASTLRVGKHVGEDPDTTRASEVVGYIVIESGQGTINGVPYTAQLGSDIVKGTGDTSTGYDYTLSGLSNVGAAAASMSGVDGDDGGWAVLYGASPVSSTELTVAIDEDALKDTERKHTSEQVAYLVFGDNVAPVVANDVLVVARKGSDTIDPRENDFDADGDSLTITGKINGSNGSVEFTGSNVTYTPSANFVGSDSFTYTVSDGQGHTKTATVDVTVAVGAPKIASATTVSNTTATSAEIAYDLTDDGGTSALITIYYVKGTNETGNAPIGYESNLALGAQANGSGTATLKNLTPNTNYQYRVYADNGVRKGSWSDVKSFTTDSGSTGSVPYADHSWKLDNGSGRKAIDSPGNRDGVLLYGPTWGEGKDGKAVRFDGFNDEIRSRAVGLDKDSSVTVSAWIKPDTVSGRRVILSQQGAYSFYVEDGKLTFKTHNNNRDGTLSIHQTTSANITAGTWQHVAVSFVPNGNVKFYRNGSRLSTLQDTKGIRGNGNGIGLSVEWAKALNTWIGRDYGNGHFDGKIDDVRIFTSALTTAQIGAVKNDIEVFFESGGQVVMEAENYISSKQRSDAVGKWTTQSSVAGSVGTYVQAPSSGYETWSTGAEIRYKVDFSTTGTYTIWVRRNAPDTASNSAWGGMDDVATGSNDNGTSQYNMWVWRSLGTVNVNSAGEHNIQVRRREKNYKIDRFVVTKNGNTPSGDGPSS